MVNSAPMVTALGLVCCAFGWAAEPVPGVVSAPARFFVEMRVGGGRLRLEADEFLVRTVDSGMGRVLLPKHLRMVLSGENQAACTLVAPGDAPGDWLSRREMELRFDERIDVQIQLPANPDWEELGRTAPLQIRIGPGEQPLVEVLATSPPVDPIPGWSVTRSGASIRTESVQSRTLRDGKWVETAPVRKRTELVPRCAVSIGSGKEGRVLRHRRIDGPDFVFEDEDLRVVRAMSANRLIAGGVILSRTVSDPLPGVQGGFGEVPLEIRWELSLGKPPDVGWFEPVLAGNEADRWVGPGGKLSFLLKLTRPDLVEALEVRLAEVSRHPGIALNGGAVLMHRPSGWTDQVRPVPVIFREEDFSLSWTRSEVVLPDSPGDSGPDLRFELADHPGFALDPTDPALLRLDGGKVGGEIPVAVTVADWAASGRLSVQVKVEGIWEDLPARGDGGTDQGVALGLPFGAGPDGVPLNFEGGAGVLDADGDGLSRAQEWRGVIVEGRHRRLSPMRREVFLSDPGACLGEEERIALRRRFSPWNVELVFLGPGETCLGSVPVIGLEDLREHFLPALLRLEDESGQQKALRAIRPRPGCAGLFVDGQVDPVALAGDLARILNLSEFGPEP